MALPHTELSKFSFSKLYGELSSKVEQYNDAQKRAARKQRSAFHECVAEVRDFIFFGNAHEWTSTRDVPTTLIGYTAASITYRVNDRLLNKQFPDFWKMGRRSIATEEAASKKYTAHRNQNANVDEFERAIITQHYGPDRNWFNDALQRNEFFVGRNTFTGLYALMHVAQQKGGIVVVNPHIDQGNSQSYARGLALIPRDLSNRDAYRSRGDQ